MDDALDADIRHDFAAELAIIRPLAEGGDAWAQYNLAGMYDDGRGVAQDRKEALKWYRLAAARRFARAQLALGAIYESGVAVPKDDVRAHMWYSLAALSFGEQSDAHNAAMARDERESLAAGMTPAQLKLAREMTETCQRSNYEDCGGPESPRIATAAPPSSKTDSPGKPAAAPTSAHSVPMEKHGGTYVVPVLINNAMTLDFVVDSGATDVSVPADVIATLMSTGTLKPGDFLGTRVYRLADGLKVPSKIFLIRSLKVGDMALENVTVSVAGARGLSLLGQSFLGRFKSWSIDNTTHSLVLQ